MVGKVTSKNQQAYSWDHLDKISLDKIFISYEFWHGWQFKIKVRCYCGK